MGIPGDTGVSIRKEGGRGDGPVFQLSFREATTEGLDWEGCQPKVIFPTPCRVRVFRGQSRHPPKVFLGIFHSL